MKLVKYAGYYSREITKIYLNIKEKRFFSVLLIILNPYTTKQPFLIIKKMQIGSCLQVVF
jgi:hypothetical protein